MTAVSMRPGVFSVGALDGGRRLFEGLMPLPDGTSYNSYLITGSTKTALVDTVDPTMKETLLNHLDGLGGKEIDYVIANHAEQDHSGALPWILERYRGARVICSIKCKEMLKDLLAISEERINTVADREIISLGDKTLEFVYFPWVHWPETMMTYLKEAKILFSCDLFGSHLSSAGLYATDEAEVYAAAKRYYAEIMMPFRVNIQGNIDKLNNYPIDIIAPSHGPLYGNPQFILDNYHKWIADQPRNLVVIPFVSMHGSTRRMVEYLADALAERDVPVKEFDLAVTDIGKLATALVDAATVVFGVPTVNAGAHPLAASVTFLFNSLRPKTRFMGIIGSYGWGGRTVEQLSMMIAGLKLEVLPPVMIKGFPREADFNALNSLAGSIAEKHKGLPKPSHLTVT